MKRTSVIYSLLLFLALTFTQIGHFGCQNESPSSTLPPTPEVEVVTVATQTVPDEPEFIGQTEAFRHVEIRSQVTGIIKKHFFAEGRDVKKGDPLYLIDPVPFKAAFLSAKAQVVQAQARLFQANQDLARVKPLLGEQAVSENDVDDALADMLAARAALEEAKGNLVKAKFDLDNTIIHAPVAGRIERSRFYKGRLVSAQTDLLTIIHELDPMYVNVSVPETYVLRRNRELASKKVQRAGIFKLKGVITFADGSTYPHEGVLDFASVGLNPETGTLQGRFVFPNPKHPVGQSMLFPGQFVRIRVIGYTRTDAILIPQRAVQQGTKGSFVYVIAEDKKVVLREVHASQWYDDKWLIEDGLIPGEQVIVEGIQRVHPGMMVEPRPFVKKTPPSLKPVPGGQLAEGS